MSEHGSRKAFAVPDKPRPSLVRQYADKKGWNLARYNVLVEGESDVTYFTLANDLYRKQHQLRLLGTDLAILPAGFRNTGGVGELQEQFRTLGNLIEADAGLPRTERFRVIAIFDNDDAGRRAFRAVTHQYSKWEAYADVFLLHRVYPRGVRSKKQFEQEVKESNRPWIGLDCEIEDLMARGIVESFISENPRCLRGQPHIAGAAHHYEWTDHHTKAHLRRFCQQYALLEDVDQLVALLQAIRDLFQLAPNGIT